MNELNEQPPVGYRIIFTERILQLRPQSVREKIKNNPKWIKLHNGNKRQKQVAKSRSMSNPITEGRKEVKPEAYTDDLVLLMMFSSLLTNYLLIFN